MRYRPPRFDCDFPLEVRLPVGLVSAVMKNVNSHGAKLTGIAGARVGDVCAMTIDGGRVFANVVWVTDGDGGAAFHRALSQRQLHLVLSTAPAVPDSSGAPQPDAVG